MRNSVARLLTGALVSTLAGGTTVANSAEAATSGPAITTSTATSFVEGSGGSFEVSVRDRLKVFIRWSGRLPTGLTLVENGDGTHATLAGIPAVGSAGTYTVHLGAVDTSGAHAGQNLVVTVEPISATIPLVHMVSPEFGSGGDVVITGSNFAKATAVHFGTIASSFTVDATGKSITAAVPAGSTGTADVTVTSPDGTSPVSVDDRFTFDVPPQPPVIVSAQSESLGIRATWAPNATSDDVTAYTVTATVDAADSGSPTAASGDCADPSPVSTDGNTRSVTLTDGVCAGVPYTVSLTATNSWGTSAPSTSSNPAVPLLAQPPSAPLITSVLARSDALIVGWAPPANSGGVVVDSYVLSARPTKGRLPVVKSEVAGGSRHFTIKGLTNDARYRLSLKARTAAGNSLPAASSGTPRRTRKPGVPESIQVAPNGNGSLVVTWTGPIDIGTAHVTSYLLSYTAVKVAGLPSATTTAGTRTIIVRAPRSAHTLSHVVASDYYSVSVRATSSAGTGRARRTTSPVTPTVKAAPGTYVVPTATMNSLVSQTVDSAGDGHILTWPASTVFGPKLSPGMVLVGSPVAAAPHGLLVMVQTVSTSESGRFLEVDATPANVNTAFRTFSFSSSSDPTFSKTFSYSSGGFTANGQVVIVPSVWLSFSYQCTASVNVYFLGYYVGAVCYQWSAGGEAGASLSASAQVAATLNGSVTIPIDSFPIGSQYFLVGYLPVYLDESVDLNLILSSTGMSISASASGSMSGQTDWSSSSGFSHHSSASFSSSVGTTAATANSTSSADLQVELNICAYGDFLCGDVAVDGILTGTVNVNAPPYFSLCPSIEISAGLEINVGLVVTSWTASTSILIATIPSSSLGGCYYVTNPPATLTIHPATPTVPIGTNVRTFTATRNDGRQPTNTWSLVNGVAGDSISSAGELSTASPGGRSLYVKDVDSSHPVAYPATRIVTVGTNLAYDPPGDLAVAFTGFPLPPYHLFIIAADVSWSPPVNTGGAPITSYILTVNGTTYTTTATDYHFAASLFQSSYNVQLRAVNANGVASPAAYLGHWVTGQIR